MNQSTKIHSLEFVNNIIVMELFLVGNKIPNIPNLKLYQAQKHFRIAATNDLEL